MQILETNPDDIPSELQGGHWCVWKAVEHPSKADKFGKVPYSPVTQRRISTGDPRTWATFDECADALDQWDGLGRLVEPSDFVFVDLDGCMRDGTPSAWSRDVIESLDSYTEISPSGKGLRIVVRGDTPGDLGYSAEDAIEIYGGEAPRYITITGQTYRAQREVRDRDVEIKRLYKQVSGGRRLSSKGKTKAPDKTEAPDSYSIDSRWEDYLREGYPADADRSRLLIATTNALLASGLDAQETLEVLCSSPGSWETAMEHRGQNAHRARQYLWDHHVCKAVDPMADFDALEGAILRKPKGGGRERVPWLFPEDLRARLGPVDCLVADFMEADALGLFFGPPESFKSFLAVDLALCVASGLPWGGLEVEQGPVIYLAGEGHAGYARRVAAWETYRSVDSLELPIAVSGVSYDFTTPSSAQQTYKALATPAQRYGRPKLIVIDTLARAFHGDENSAEAMGRFLGHVDRLREVWGCTVLIVHHSGGTAGRARGSTALRGAVDWAFRIERRGAMQVEIKPDKTKNMAAPEPLVFEGFDSGPSLGFDLTTQGFEDESRSAEIVEAIEVCGPEAELVAAYISTDVRGLSELIRSSDTLSERYVCDSEGLREKRE